MDGTCKKDKCPFWKEHGAQCPFFIETVWVTNEGQKKMVEDCAPIRGMLLQQDYYNRSIALQKTQEELRNEVNETNVKLKDCVARTNLFMKEAEAQMYEIRKLQSRHNKLIDVKKAQTLEMEE